MKTQRCLSSDIVTDPIHDPSCHAGKLSHLAREVSGRQEKENGPNQVIMNVVYLCNFV
jgi:hypothetical protein